MSPEMQMLIAQVNAIDTKLDKLIDLLLSDTKDDGKKILDTQCPHHWNVENDTCILCGETFLDENGFIK